MKLSTFNDLRVILVREAKLYRNKKFISVVEKNLGNYMFREPIVLTEILNPYYDKLLKTLGEDHAKRFIIHVALQNFIHAQTSYPWQKKSKNKVTFKSAEKIFLKFLKYLSPHTKTIFSKELLP